MGTVFTYDAGVRHTVEALSDACLLTIRARGPKRLLSNTG